MSVEEITKQITPIFEEYGIEKASIFGSVSRSEHTKDSDIDIMVRFTKPIGLISYVQFTDKLKGALGTEVDVISEGAVNDSLRPHIEKDLQTIYKNAQEHPGLSGPGMNCAAGRCSMEGWVRSERQCGQAVITYQNAITTYN